MQKTDLSAQLTRVKGVLMEFWGEVTGDEKEFAAGRREQVVAALQQKHGLSHAEAEAEFDRFVGGE